jgi:hypothetical protein
MTTAPYELVPEPGGVLARINAQTVSAADRANPRQRRATFTKQCMPYRLAIDTQWRPRVRVGAAIKCFTHQLLGCGVGPQPADRRAPPAATICSAHQKNVIAFHHGSKPTCPPVVADHHRLRCRCPLCEVNRRIGLHDSNGVAHACDSDTRRCPRPSSVT